MTKWNAELGLTVALAFCILPALGCGGDAASTDSSPASTEGGDLARQYSQAWEEAGETVGETAEVASAAAMGMAEQVEAATQEIPAETEKFADELDILMRTTSPSEVMMRLAEALEEFTQEIQGGHPTDEDRLVIVTSLDVMYDKAEELREMYVTDADPVAMEQLDDLMKEIYTLQDQLLEGSAGQAPN